MAHENADAFFPGLEIRFAPRSVVLSGLRLLEWILNTAADAAVGMPAGDVLGVVRDGGTGMTMLNPSRLNPFGDHVARLERIKDEIS